MILKKINPLVLMVLLTLFTTQLHAGSEIIVCEDTPEYKIHFDFESAFLKKISQSVLDDLLKTLASLIKKNPKLIIAIEGHSDSIEMSSEKTRKQLAKLRAMNVRSYFIRQGFSIKRFKINSYGSQKPIDTNESAAGRANNRRVEFKAILDESK